MCDPVSALMAVGTAVSVVGGIQQGNAAAAAAQQQAQMNQQNAILADRRAKDALERGALEEERKLREATMLRKEQEASFAASNLDTGYGTPLDVIVSTDMAARLDADIIRANAEREAEDFELEANNYRNQSILNQAEGRNVKRASRIGAISTAVSGGAGIFKYRAGLD